MEKNQPKYEVKIDKEEFHYKGEFDSFFYIVTFTFISDGLGCEITYSDFSVITLKEGRELIEAIKENKKYALSFVNCNGESTIYTEKGMTEFVTDKSGSGGDSVIKVSITNGDALPLIEKMVNTVWENEKEE